MVPRDADAIGTYFDESVTALAKAAADSAFLEACHAIATVCRDSLRGGGKILLAGNGGSAADAQHIAGELVSRLNFDRRPLAAIALTVDTSVLTAVGNDYGYEHVFERQVRCLANPGDVFVGITTSGRSRNVLNAFVAARERGAHVISFCGADAEHVTPLCDLVLAAPSTSTPLIQQIHMAAAHAICGEVEAAIFSRT